MSDVREQITSPLQYNQSHSFSVKTSALLNRIIASQPKDIHQIINANWQQQCQLELNILQNTQQNENQNQLALKALLSLIRSLLIEQKQEVYTSTLVTQDSHYTPQAIVFTPVFMELQRNQEQIKSFLKNVMKKSTTSIDYLQCYHFFQSQLKQLNDINKTQNKLQNCAINTSKYLLETIGFFLGDVITRYQPQKLEQLDKQQSGNVFGEYPSFEQVNEWRRVNAGLGQQKIVQLSSVCEQIPQLQMFKRNLAFWQVESQAQMSIGKVTDVLISLHKRVGQLSRKKPELMQQLDNAQNQLKQILQGFKGFLREMQSGKITVLKFELKGKLMQLSQGFRQLKNQLSRLGNLVQNRTRNDQGRVVRLVSLVQIFSGMLSNDPQCEQQWRQLIHLHQHRTDLILPQQQYSIIGLLQNIMLNIPTKSSLSRVNSQQFQSQVNKLIAEYEHIKEENAKLNEYVNNLVRQKEDLVFSLSQRDGIIHNLMSLKSDLQIRMREEQQQYRSQQNQLTLLRIQRDIQLDRQRQKYVKLYQSYNKLLAQKLGLEFDTDNKMKEMQIISKQYDRQIAKLNKQIIELNDQKVRFEDQSEEIRKEKERLITRIEGYEKRIQEYVRLFESKVDKQDKQQKEEITQNQQMIINLKEEIQQLRQQCTRIKQQNHILRQNDKKNNLRLYQLEELNQNVIDRRQRVQKLTSKNKILTNENTILIEEMEQLENKIKINAKKLKTAEQQLRQKQTERQRMEHELALKNRRINQSQKQIQSLTQRLEFQLRNSGQSITKKQLQLTQKTIKIQCLQFKLKGLQQQLTKRQVQLGQSNTQLMVIKLRQCQSRIQSHRIVQTKFQQHFTQLKSEIEVKIQNQIRLSFEVDRLNKQIDRMRIVLDLYLRQIAEKQSTIKRQSEKNSELLKQIRESELVWQLGKDKQQKRRQTQQKQMREKNYINQTAQIQIVRLKQQLILIKQENSQLLKKMERENSEMRGVMETNNELRKHNQLYTKELMASLGESHKQKEQLIKSIEEMKVQKQKLAQQLTKLRQEDGFQINKIKEQNAKLTIQLQKLQKQVHGITNQRQSMVLQRQAFFIQRQQLIHQQSILSHQQSFVNQSHPLHPQSPRLRTPKHHPRHSLNMHSQRQIDMSQWSGRTSQIRLSQQNKNKYIWQITKLLAQRDIILNQSNNMRRQLEEQARKICYLQQQLKKKQEEVRIKSSSHTSTATFHQYPIEYYANRVALLETALGVLGQEYNQIKGAEVQLSRKTSR